MNRKQRTEQEKFAIVLEGLRGDVLISALCSKHEIHQSQYYAWRDLLLRKGSSVFNMNKQSQRAQVQERKMKRMQEVIGELTLELKKND